MARSWGSTPQWRRVRRRVLERDGYECQLRLPGCSGRTEECHHRFGRLRPGQPLGRDDYDPALLIAACRNCHRVKLPAGPATPPGHRLVSYRLPAGTFAPFRHDRGRARFNRGPTSSPVCAARALRTKSAKLNPPSLPATASARP